jgi:hypothetical protein
MASRLEDIQDRVQQLDIEEKHALLRTLLDDLEPPLDEEFERAWLLEAQRRYQETVDGKATFVPASVVFERIRSRRKS